MYDICVATIDDQEFSGLDSHVDCSEAFDYMIKDGRAGNFLVCPHGVVAFGSPLIGPAVKFWYVRGIGEDLTRLAKVSLKRIAKEVLSDETAVWPSLGCSLDLQSWVAGGMILEQVKPVTFWRRKAFSNG